MHKVKVLFTQFVTHDTRAYIIEKPADYNFHPGQATDVAINKPDWQDQKRPFTFTSHPDDLALEFTIKSYPNTPDNDHDGMTEALSNIQARDELLIDDPWGTIEYKGTGTFIAAGAGITPFIAVLRQLAREDKIHHHNLFFCNKKAEDIIYEKELKHLFRDADDKLILTLTRDNQPNYLQGRIDQDLLKEYITDFSQHFYVCGPPPFTKEVTAHLKALGASADSIIFEK